MKGLKRYIAKHGRHFTEELASAVTRRNWNPSKIEQEAQKRVYYNVTGTTLGDMVYMMDTFQYYLNGDYTLRKGINMMLSWIGDYNKAGSPFCMWVTVSEYHKEDFDLTPYI